MRPVHLESEHVATLNIDVNQATLAVRGRFHTLVDSAVVSPVAELSSAIPNRFALSQKA
jgi:hypothetical protein